MTNLFTKITNQMITNCKDCVLEGEESDSHVVQLKLRVYDAYSAYAVRYI